MEPTTFVLVFFGTLWIIGVLSWKMNEQKEKYIQSERNKIRAKRTEKALKDAKEYKEPEVKFERPVEG